MARQTEALTGFMTIRRYFVFCSALPVVLPLIALAIELLEIPKSDTLFWRATNVVGASLPIGLAPYLLLLAAVFLLEPKTLRHFRFLSIVAPPLFALLVAAFWALLNLKSIDVLAMFSFASLILGYCYVACAWCVYFVLRRMQLIDHSESGRPA